jgi:polyribonucleotide 5'-hydroxyl-kinase
MSLPGLELTAPSIEAHNIPAAPTQISLSKGSEWRFEIAFGNTVRVKVCGTVASGHVFLYSLVCSLCCDVSVV